MDNSTIQTPESNQSICPTNLDTRADLMAKAYVINARQRKKRQLALQAKDPKSTQSGRRNIKEKKVTSDSNLRLTLFQKLATEMVTMIMKDLTLKEKFNFVSTSKQLRTLQGAIPVEKFKITNKYFKNEKSVLEDDFKKKLNKLGLKQNYKVCEFEEAFYDTGIVMYNKFMKINHIMFDTTDPYSEKSCIICPNVIDILSFFDKKNQIKKLTLDQPALFSLRIIETKTNLSETCPGLKELVLYHSEEISYDMEEYATNNSEVFHELYKSNSKIFEQLNSLTLNCLFDTKKLNQTMELGFPNLKNLDLSLIKFPDYQDTLEFYHYQNSYVYKDLLEDFANNFFYTIVNEIPNLEKLRLPLYDSSSMTKEVLYLFRPKNFKKLRALSTSVSRQSFNTIDVQEQELGFAMTEETIFKQLYELQIFMSKENDGYMFSNFVSPERHNWILDNISDNLVVFDCFWFLIHQKNLIKLKKACPNLKELGCASFPFKEKWNSDTMHDDLLRHILEKFPNLEKLRLECKPWIHVNNYHNFIQKHFENDDLSFNYDIDKVNIYEDIETLEEVLTEYKNLNQLWLYHNFEEINSLSQLKKFKNRDIRGSPKFEYEYYMDGESRGKQELKTSYFD